MRPPSPVPRPYPRRPENKPESELAADGGKTFMTASILDWDTLKTGTDKPTAVQVDPDILHVKHVFEEWNRHHEEAKLREQQLKSGQAFAEQRATLRQRRQHVPVQKAPITAQQNTWTAGKLPKLQSDRRPPGRRMKPADLAQLDDMLVSTILPCFSPSCTIMLTISSSSPSLSREVDTICLPYPQLMILPPGIRRVL